MFAIQSVFSVLMNLNIGRKDILQVPPKANKVKELLNFRKEKIA